MRAARNQGGGHAIVDLELLPRGPAHRAALDRLAGIVVPERAIPGYATVELDRAATDLAHTLRASRARPAEDLPGDAALGARCRLLTFADGSELVLLEPVTEGRLAASLARYGEGVAAIYVFADRAAKTRIERAGIALGIERVGPFGAQRLVVDGRRDSTLVIVSRPYPGG